MSFHYVCRFSIGKACTNQQRQQCTHKFQCCTIQGNFPFVVMLNFCSFSFVLMFAAGDEATVLVLKLDIIDFSNFF